MVQDIRYLVYWHPCVVGSGRRAWDALGTFTPLGRGRGVVEGGDHRHQITVALELEAVAREEWNPMDGTTGFH